MMQGKADLICIEADFYFIKRAKSFFTALLIKMLVRNLARVHSYKNSKCAL